MPGLLRLLGTAALAAGVVACGSVKTQSGPDAHVDALIHLPDGPPAKDRCKDSVELGDLGSCLTETFCGEFSACGFGQTGDVDCSDLPFNFFNGLTTRNLVAGITQEISAGRLSYDPVAAAACIASLKTTACKTLFGSNGSPLDACAMFVGKVPANNGCGFPIECAAGTACIASSGNTYSGTCGNDVCKTRVAVNQSCATAPCQVGDHCVANVCRHGDLNAACAGDDSDCDPDFFCNVNVCAAQFAKDATCDRDRQCSGQLACVGESLTPAAGKCEDVSTAGAACDTSCFGPFLCEAPAVTALGKCVAEPAEGAACVSSTVNSAKCGAIFMRCDDKGTPNDPADDICRTPGDLGAACMQNSGGCNLGLVCTADVAGTPTGVCRAPLPNNSGCTKADQCASGNCQQQLCAPFQACSL